MPRSYRSIILAGLGFITLAASPQNERHDQQRRDKSHSVPATTHQQPDAGKAEKPAQGCEGTSEPTLDCNAISAQASLDQARYAGEGIGISKAGTVIGGLTLLAAILAAFFAERAAYHTKRSADIATQDRRPWVSMKMRLLDIKMVGQDVVFHFEVEYTNHGRDLAYCSGAWPLGYVGGFNGVSYIVGYNDKQFIEYERRYDPFEHTTCFNVFPGQTVIRKNAMRLQRSDWDSAIAHARDLRLRAHGIKRCYYFVGKDRVWTQIEFAIHDIPKEGGIEGVRFDPLMGKAT